MIAPALRFPPDSWEGSGANAAHDFRLLEGVARRQGAERCARGVDYSAPLVVECRVVVEGQGGRCRAQEQRFIDPRLRQQKRRANVGPPSSGCASPAKARARSRRPRIWYLTRWRRGSCLITGASRASARQKSARSSPILACVMVNRRFPIHSCQPAAFPISSRTRSRPASARSTSPRCKSRESRSRLELTSGGTYCTELASS